MTTLIVKDGEYRANLFVDVARYIKGSDLTMWGRTDSSLRLVVNEAGEWFIASPAAGRAPTRESEYAHKMRFDLLTEALESREFVLLAAVSDSGKAVFTNRILRHLKYLTYELQDSTQWFDLLTGALSSHSVMTPLAVAVKIQELDLIVMYTSNFLKSWATLPWHGTGLSVYRVTDHQGYLINCPERPRLTGAQLLGDAILAENVFDFDLFPTLDADKVSSFLSNRVKIESSLPFKVLGRTIRISSRKSVGYLRICLDFGPFLSASSEKTVLEYVVRNTNPLLG